MLVGQFNTVKYFLKFLDLELFQIDTDRLLSLVDSFLVYHVHSLSTVCFKHNIIIICRYSRIRYDCPG